MYTETTRKPPVLSLLSCYDNLELGSAVIVRIRPAGKIRIPRSGSPRFPIGSNAASRPILIIHPPGAFTCNAGAVTEKFGVRIIPVHRAQKDLAERRAEHQEKCMQDTSSTPPQSPKKAKAEASVSLTQFDEKITNVLGKSTVRLNRVGVKRIRNKFLRDALDRITPDAVLPLVHEEIEKLATPKT